MLPVLGMFGEFFSDANFLLKLFVLMAIVQYAMMHLGKTPMAYAIIAAFSYFVFFSDLWALFGGVYLLYMLFMIGISGIIIDFFFVTQGAQGAPGAGQGETDPRSPVDSGRDLAERMHQIQGRGHAPHPGMGMRPPPMRPG